MYERLIQKLINRKVGDIGGTLTPTGGTTYCTITGGSFPYTYDGSTSTGVLFKVNQNCLSEWYWDTPVDVTKFWMHSVNYNVDSKIVGMWGFVAGSWVQLWSGTWHPTHNSWDSVVAVCNNCTGIRISQVHATTDACAIGEVKVDYELPPGTSGTASFQETSATVGDTIHADFTWTNAVLRPLPYLHYAAMNIKDPDGNVCGTTYFELINPSGSKSLSCVTDMAGTWTCQIDVWQGVFYMSWTDTVVVSVPGAPTLTEAVTCLWVEGLQNHGLKVTQFDIDAVIYSYAEIALHGNDAYGKVMKHEWWYKETGASSFTKKWEWETTCTEHYTNNWATWTWWAIGLVHGAGTGYIKIFFDGIEMGQTDVYTVVSDEGEANIISVDEPSSFIPNVSFHIKPSVRNDGASDTLFLGLTDTDTGVILKHPSTYTYYAPSGQIWEQDWIVTLSQTTTFHGRIDAGHVED